MPTDEPLPSSEQPTGAPASAPERHERASMDERVLDIMAKQSEQLVTVTGQGFTDLRAETRAMGQSVVQANNNLGDRFEKALSRWAIIVVLALAIVGGLVGLSITLPDGTRVSPSDRDNAGRVESVVEEKDDGAGNGATESEDTGRRRETVTDETDTTGGHPEPDGG